MNRLILALLPLASCSLIFEQAPQLEEPGCCSADYGDESAAFTGTSSADDPRLANCRKDSDCADGLRCIADYRVCVPSGPDAGSPDAGEPDAAPDAMADATPPLGPPCESVVNQTGCGGSEGCYYDYSGDTGYCHAEGSGGIGDSCQSQHDCQGGFACDDLCWPACLVQSDCESGWSCAPSIFPDLKRCVITGG